MMKNLLKTLWLAELLLALLIIFGVADATMSYISLFVLGVGIWKLSDLEALKFYIYSIPIFVAMPENFLSSSMSVWRFALLIFILKVVFERFGIPDLIRDRNLTFAGKGRELKQRAIAFVHGAQASDYRRLAASVLAFFAVAVFSLVFAQSLGAGIKQIIFLGSIFLIFGIVTWAVRTKEQVEDVLKSVFVTLGGVMAVGFLQFLSTFFITLSDFWGMWNEHVINAFYGEKMMTLLSYSNTWFSYYDDTGDIPPTLRMFSVMPDSHSFSMLMIILVPLALYYHFSSVRKSEKNQYLAVLALSLLSILLSGSRGAWVGWLGALAAASYFWFYKKLSAKVRVFKIQDFEAQKKAYKMVLRAMLLLVVLIPVSMASLNASQDVYLIREGRALDGSRNAFLHRTFSIGDMDETSNKGRLEIWRDSAVSFAKHPVLGIGIGNFPYALSEKIGASKMGSSAHNIYLHIAVEMGVIGLAAFLWILWNILDRIFILSQKLREEKHRLLSLSFFVSLVWILTYGVFDVVILNDKVLTFIVILVAVFYKMESLEGQGNGAKKA